MSQQLNNSSAVGIVDEDLANLLQAAIAPLSFTFVDTEADLDLFAEICVQIALGNYVSPELAPMVEDDEEVEVDEEPLTLEEITSVNPDRGMYGVKVGKDTEVEYGYVEEDWQVVWDENDVPQFNLVTTFIPYSAINDNLSSYFTNSGDNPVIRDQAYQAEYRRSAGGFSDVDWEYGLPTNLDSYIESLYWSIKSHEAFERRDRTVKWLDLIQKQPKNANFGRLRALFWKRIYGAKSLLPYTAAKKVTSGAGCYMTSKQVAALAEEFRRKGSWLLRRDA